MELEAIRTFCLNLPGVTEDIKWDHHLCFSVGDKMFIVTSPDEYPITASFKTTPEKFEYYTAKEGFNQAPYFAKNQWLHIDNIERISDDEWKMLLQTAYDLIFAKLALKKQREILNTTNRKPVALKKKKP